MKPANSCNRSDHYLFYAEDLSSDQITLSATEAVHAVTVLRLTAGATLFLTDGNGCKAEGTIISIAGKKVSVSITVRTTIAPPQPAIHLFVGLPERDAFEQMLTAVTPFEIRTITPLVTAFTQKPWWKKTWDKQFERFTGKMITALKQSHANHLPELQPPITFSNMSISDDTAGFVADQNGSSLQPAAFISGMHSISCFIGPPGGFSDKELKYLKEHNCKTVKIARNRLRTELAATTIIAQISGFIL